MANEKTPVVWDDDAKKHRPLGSGEKMGGLSASSMISSDSGNLLQQGSDGLMLVTGGSIADPRADNLLEESANGRLQVTSDRVVEWLEGHPQAAAAIAEAVKVVSGDDGNVIVAGTDKGAFLPKQALSNAVATMSSAQLATLANALRKQGGGLSVGSDGKLSVDFGSMDPAIMRAVVLSMVQQGGGIAVDQSGKLYVDFDSMPTDKFEAMMKSLKMLVPLDATKNLYVSTTNAAASDTLDDGRGTQAKPFKTIQACVNYLTSTYSLGRFDAVINVVAGTYSENVTLPSYSRGTGRIHIVAASGSRDVIINGAENYQGFLFSPIQCTGGSWVLRNLSIMRTETMYTGTDDGRYGCLIHADGDTAEIIVQGCLFSQKFPSGVSEMPGVQYMIRLIYIENGAKMSFRPWGTPCAIVADNLSGTRTVNVFDIQRGSSFVFYRPVPTSETQSYSREVACSGSMSCFVNVSQGSSVNSTGGGPKFDFTGTMTGKRYSVNGGSYIAAGQPATYFPGDVEGTVQDATYCWYQ